uniref:IBR domain containing protein n=1 Tax=Haemonchus contortus TaxID=6289 RepID=A0A7I4YZ90_HAECO
TAVATMSFDEEQENVIAPHDLARNSWQFRSSRRHRRGDALLRKKLTGHVVVSKTLYDPADTLSNKAKKRLLKEESWNDFHPDVQYSLNKHQRWRTINVPSLLENADRSDLEVLVVNRVITPRNLSDIQNLDVSNVHMKDNGMINTLSTRGKGQKLSHFHETLRERRQMDKDEIEPARILFNVVEPHPVLSILAGKTQRKNKRGSWTKSRHVDYGSDLSHENRSEDEYEDRPDVSLDVARAPRSSFTLGDFLVSSSPSKDTSEDYVEESDSWEVIDPEPEWPTEIIQPKPADLVDISAATNADSVFEVIDVETKNWQNFDFHKTVALLEKERMVVRWIDEDRAMVDASRQARVSGDELLQKPLLILFFELRDGGRVLRVRVNANTRYVNGSDRGAFLHRAKCHTDFTSLLNHITETVRSLRLRNLDVPKEKSRCMENEEFFAAEVNSEALAIKADRCNEYDRLQFLRDVGNGADSRRTNEPEHIPSVRCCCSSWKRTELFETKDGMSCRDCITSHIVHQLRLNHVPVDISLPSTENLSSIDLLYAVLPVPLISVLIKMSYSYYRHLRDPNVVFSECPRCTVEVAIASPNEGSTNCICPECESHWCWLCNSEPHWPMNCEEFKQWVSKWDQQYFVDKYRLQPDEDLLRITCLCGTVLILPSESAHNTVCRCGHRYDKTGLMSLNSKYFPYYARSRKFHDLEGKPKQGDPVPVERIAPVQLIAKEFADICTEARNLRFDKKRRVEFEKSVSASRLNESDLINQRRTSLVLIENCTAWLYLHRREGVFGTCRSSVSRLFQRICSIENEFSETSPSPILLRNIRELKKDIGNVMNLFQESVHKVKEE